MKGPLLPLDRKAYTLQPMTVRFLSTRFVLALLAVFAGYVPSPGLSLAAGPPPGVVKPQSPPSAATSITNRETHLRFEAYWGGFHTADFVLSLRNGGKAYNNTFRLETRGLADLFLRLKIIARSRGEAILDPPGDGPTGDEIGAYAPTLYELDYTNRRRERSVRVAFGNGHARPTIRTKGATAEEDREKEKKVAEKYRTGVMDPLTALAEIFRRAGAHLKGGPASFRLAVYDGRRRFDLVGEFRGRTRRTILRRGYDLYHVRVRARPIAGFKDSHKELWNDQAYDIYLSTDGALLPIQIMSIGNGPVMNLREVCPGPCRLEGG